MNIGDNIGLMDITTYSCEYGFMETNTQDYFQNKNVVLFAAIGAFTPTCHSKHLPDYQEYATKFFEKGIDKILCITVNDKFVIRAWDDSLGSKNIEFLSDPDAVLIKNLGLHQDLSQHGLGVRPKRFCSLVKNGFLDWLVIDEVGMYELCKPANVLEFLNDKLGEMS
jgi:glutaredoxin/glutathione-dependent peroxiredoxin